MEQKKILVIDDEKDILRILVYGLQSWGYEVITATNGQQGLDKIKAEKPDLVMLDADMPVMNGLVMLRQLRNIPDFRHIPVIMLTSYSDPRIAGIVSMHGISEYITKPFDPTELKEKIEKALSFPNQKA
jgi:CheY-like chemotaxis protein